MQQIRRRWWPVRRLAYLLRRFGLRDLWIYAEYKYYGLDRVIINGEKWWIRQ